MLLVFVLQKALWSQFSRLGAGSAGKFDRPRCTNAVLGIEEASSGLRFTKLQNINRWAIE